jgi:hypothetical protein
LPAPSNIDRSNLPASRRRTRPHVAAVLVLIALAVLLPTSAHGHAKVANSSAPQLAGLICETGHIPAGVASLQAVNTGDAGCATARSAACSFDCYLHKQFGVTKFPPPKGCGYHVVPAGIYFKPQGSPKSRKVMRFKRGHGRIDSVAGVVTWTDSATLKSGYVWCSYRQQFFVPGTVTCTPGGPQPWDGLEIAGPQVAHVRTISCTTTQPVTKGGYHPLPRFEGYARKQKQKR